ncbi:hypothetical protein ACLOJK_031468 [Asimina triloba]
MRQSTKVHCSRVTNSPNAELGSGEFHVHATLSLSHVWARTIQAMGHRSSVETACTLMKDVMETLITKAAWAEPTFAQSSCPRLRRAFDQKTFDMS